MVSLNTKKHKRKPAEEPTVGFVKSIPKKYKGKPIGKVFRAGDFDVLITRCEPPHFKFTAYYIETCSYRNDSFQKCNVNRFGCSIHRRSPGPNIFGIED